MSWWPLIKLVPKETKFTYVKFAGFAAFLSVAAVLGSFASMCTAGFQKNPIAMYEAAEGGPFERLGAMLSEGFNLGIDFKGGALLVVESPSPIDSARVRSVVVDLGFGDVQVQETGCKPEGNPNHCVIVRSEVRGEGTQTLDQIRGALTATLTDVRFVSADIVGAKVSSELFSGGLMALGMAIVLMLIYIWFRFEWQFGLGGVLALFHDIILTLGLFSVFRFEFTLTIIAALLTIVGYSMNDTVVVFDRIRENLRKFKKMPLGELIDLSLNQTLSRTIITGCTALLALVGLLYFGGEALSGFAIAMIFGILIGTYSSLYVAAPAILIWGVKRGEGEPVRTRGADLVEDRP